MRTLVTPPSSSRCKHCNGELRLKQVGLAERAPAFQSQTLVCIECGHQVACHARLDRYVGRRAPAGTVLGA